MGNFSIFDVIPLIRDSGGKGNILCLVNELHQDLIDEIQGSTFYNVFLAVASLRNTYFIYGKCPYCNDGENSMEKFNEWSMMRGFENNLLFPVRFKENLNNTIMRVAQRKYESSTYIQSHKNKTRYKNFEYDMLYDLSKMMNFKFLLLRPPDRELGRLVNGSWTGVIGLLVRRDADLANGIITLNENRLAYVQPTPIVSQVSHRLLLAKPPLMLRWQVIFEAFTLKLWAATFFSIIALGFSLYIIQKFNEKEEKISMGKAIFVPFQTLCIESVNVRRPSCSKIILLGVWMSMSTLIIGFYCGNVTSLALGPGFKEKPIDTKDELLKSGKRWIIRENYMREIHPELQHIRKNVDATKTSVTYYLDMVKEYPNKFVYAINMNLNTVSAIKYYLERDGKNPFYFSTQILDSVDST